jgi:hypothetical protein
MACMRSGVRSPSAPLLVQITISAAAVSQRFGGVAADVGHRISTSLVLVNGLDPPNEISMRRALWRKCLNPVGHGSTLSVGTG